MTNKTLSEQICKVCGIKKKRITLWCNCEGCKYLIDDECKRGDNPCKPPYKYVYPDFGNSNNYIRLEEIMLAELAKHHLTVVKWVHYWSDNTLMHEYILITKTGHKIRFKHNDIQVDNWFVERKNRADCLILFILWKVIPICGESIKQAIRQADWEV